MSSRTPSSREHRRRREECDRPRRGEREKRRLDPPNTYSERTPRSHGDDISRDDAPGDQLANLSLDSRRNQSPYRNEESVSSESHDRKGESLHSNKERSNQDSDEIWGPWSEYLWSSDRNCYYSISTSSRGNKVYQYYNNTTVSSPTKAYDDGQAGNYIASTKDYPLTNVQLQSKVIARGQMGSPADSSRSSYSMTADRQSSSYTQEPRSGGFGDHESYVDTSRPPYTSGNLGYSCHTPQSQGEGGFGNYLSRSLHDASRFPTHIPSGGLPYNSSPLTSPQSHEQFSRGTGTPQASFNYAQNAQEASRSLPPILPPIAVIPCGCCTDDGLCGVIIDPGAEDSNEHKANHEKHSSSRMSEGSKHKSSSSKSKESSSRSKESSSKGKGSSAKLKDKPARTSLTFFNQGTSGANCGPLLIPSITPGPEPAGPGPEWDKWDEGYQEWKSITCPCGYGYFNRDGIWINGALVQSHQKPFNPLWAHNQGRAPDSVRRIGPNFVGGRDFLFDRAV
ncbi:hypothetical protein B0J14DRAFT_664698 [Halenospora varia]|nr:hypothetical protein B0J14DRAFT_664698 [Halenospora varia]